MRADNLSSEDLPLQPDADPLRPGTTGIWTFLGMDLCVFALFFLVYLSERHRLPHIFQQGQAQLAPLAGLLSTLLLLTGSWMVADAVRCVRCNALEGAASRLTFGILFGCGFCANKLWEYYLKIAHGVTPLTNGFFTFYFLITGLHLIHVVIGTGLLAHCRSRLSVEAGTLDFQKKFENVGLFWHVVDMLWLFIFPMLYLAGTR